MSDGVGRVGQALRQSPGEAQGTLQRTDNQSTVPSTRFPSSESWPWRPEFQGPESDGRRVRRGPVTPHVVAGAGTRQVESPLSTCEEGGPWGKPHGDTYALRPPSSMCLLVTWGKRKQSVSLECGRSDCICLPQVCIRTAVWTQRVLKGKAY